jgi:hypothetical protein
MTALSRTVLLNEARLEPRADSLANWTILVDRLASNWSGELVEHGISARPEARERMNREIRAFANQIALIRQGLSRAGGPYSGPFLPWRDFDEGLSGGRGVIEPVEPPAYRSSEASDAACPVLAAHSPQLPGVTRESFERFCRWTGMDDSCLSGSAEHVASLVFYLIAFSVLTDQQQGPDVRSQLLLSKLRRCRESISRAVDDCFGIGQEAD